MLISPGRYAASPDALERFAEEHPVRALIEALQQAGIRDPMTRPVCVATLEELIAYHAVALFYPHGVGHLLGLDVHDMEDLGDRAGYAPGRSRQQHPSAPAVGPLDAFGQFGRREVQSGEVSGVGVVPQAAIDRIGTGINGGDEGTVAITA